MNDSLRVTGVAQPFPVGEPVNIGSPHPGPSSTCVSAIGTARLSTKVGPDDPEREPPSGHGQTGA